MLADDKPESRSDTVVSAGRNQVSAHRNPSHEILVLRGFRSDAERDLICEKLRVIFGQELGVKEW